MALIPLVAALAGCSAVFPNPQAPSDGLSTLVSNAQRNYEIIPLTFDTVREANRRWAYEPKRLPAFLQYGALTPSSGAVRASTMGATTLGDGVVFTQAAQATVSRNRRINPPPRSAPEPYVIGAGDVVILSFGGRELVDAALAGDGSGRQSTYTVSGGGSIYHPLIGTVEIAGLTPDSARERIQEILSNQFIDSDAYFDIVEFNSQRVIVASTSGTAEIIPVTSRPLTLREAYFAGSQRLPLNENQAFVEIYRNGDTYRLRASDVVSQTLGYPVYLSDGDYIRIDDPELRAIEQAELSAERDRLDIQRGQFGISRRSADLADRNFDLSARRFEREERQFDIARQQFELQRAEAERAEQSFYNTEGRLNAAERRAEAAELRAQAAERRSTREEARLDAIQRRAEAAEQRAREQERRLDSAESRAQSQELRAQSQEQRAQSQEQRAIRGEGRLDRELELQGRNEQRNIYGDRNQYGASERDRVYVGGEVRSPTLLEMPFERHMSLAEAIFGAEDIQPLTGDPRKIYVARRGFSADRSDKTYLFQLDLSNLANAPLATAFQLRPEDVVYVSSRGITNWNRFITQVIPSVATSAVATGVAATR